MYRKYINPIKACLINIVGLASPSGYSESKFYADSEFGFRIFLPSIFQILGNFREVGGKIKTLLQKWDPTSKPTSFIDIVVH